MIVIEFLFLVWFYWGASRPMNELNRHPETSAVKLYFLGFLFQELPLKKYEWKIQLFAVKICTSKLFQVRMPMARNLLKKMARNLMLGSYS